MSCVVAVFTNLTRTESTLELTFVTVPHRQRAENFPPEHLASKALKTNVVTNANPRGPI